MSYLTRRDGRYSYRRRFPKAVADMIGMGEYRKALGTSDPAEAGRLARALSVEFDSICAAALAKAQAVPEEAEPVPTTETAEELLSSLDSVVRTFTLSVVDRMAAPGWQREIAWQKRALKAHADGSMPEGVQMHPLKAKALLRSLEAVEDGNPGVRTAAPAQTLLQPEIPGNSPVSTCHAEQFKAVLDGYCEDVSPARAQKMRGLSRLVLRWPATMEQQVERVLAFSAEKLLAGNKTSSVHSDAAGLIAVLRRVPGWGDARLPKADAITKQITTGHKMGKDQRDSIRVPELLAIHSNLKAQFPQHHTAALLLARYGLRPVELLSEGPAALVTELDIMGRGQLVFRVALSGGKNAASRRNLPVHPDDAALFREVLTGLDMPTGATRHERDRRIRQRVTNLSRAFGRFTDPDTKTSLYSQRHTFADLLRDVGALNEEVSAILGHAEEGSKATAVYGGMQSLERRAELLGKVRALIPG